MRKHAESWRKSMCDANKRMKGYYAGLLKDHNTSNGFYFDFNETDNNFVL